MFAPETISIGDFKDYDLILISPRFERLAAVYKSTTYGYEWNIIEDRYKFYGHLVSRKDIGKFLAGKEVEVYT